MVYAARFADEFREAAGFGWTLAAPRFDWATLKRNRDAEVARLEGIYAVNLERAGVAIRRERAVVEGPHAVRLASGERVTARHILVATGGHPVKEPAVPGLELAITSNEVFELEALPERLLVVGGGYIAVEFAGVFHGLGSRTTLVHRGDQLLRGFDAEVREGLGEAYRERGIDLRLSTTITRLERRGDGIHATLSDGSVVVADQVLVATGRRPNTGGLGLEAAGVALEPDGAVPVDAYSATRVPSIHAVGDVTNRVPLTPIAIREGHAFADTVFGGRPTAVDHDLVASAVFSTPEIGAVGHGEEVARRLYGEVEVYKTRFRPMKATLSGAADRVFMKLVVDKASDVVVGAHVMGHDAGEIIQALAVAVTMGATKADFDRTVAVHPTAGEEFVTMRTPAVVKTPQAVG
jgi:glutathione reductase (NADPH)